MKVTNITKSPTMMFVCLIDVIYPIIYLIHYLLGWDLVDIIIGIALILLLIPFITIPRKWGV